MTCPDDGDPCTQDICNPADGVCGIVDEACGSTSCTTPTSAISFYCIPFDMLGEYTTTDWLVLTTYPGDGFTIAEFLVSTPNNDNYSEYCIESQFDGAYTPYAVDVMGLAGSDTCGETLIAGGPMSFCLTPDGYESYIVRYLFDAALVYPYEEISITVSTGCN